MTKEYLFGDTELAARRLEVLAGVFATSSAAFVSASVERGLPLAVDLGCGPGHTTHMLAAALQCARTIGLDKSEHFIALAERTATDSVSFALHDVTTAPFPVGPCDVVYCRFLLTHQTDPEALIAAWAGQLRPGGRLLLEEVDAIHMTVRSFTEYLGIVAAMLADSGRDLYVGPRLDAMPAPAGLVKLASRAAPLPVTNDVAAKMFSMNIQTWKHNAFVQNNCSGESVHQLELALADLAATTTDAQGIEWRLRQIVYEAK